MTGWPVTSKTGTVTFPTTLRKTASDLSPLGGKTGFSVTAQGSQSQYYRLQSDWNSQSQRLGPRTVSEIPFWKVAEYSKLQGCRNLESISVLGNKDPGRVQSINRIKSSDLWRKDSISLFFFYTLIYFPLTIKLNKVSEYTNLNGCIFLLYSVLWI